MALTITAEQARERAQLDRAQVEKDTQYALAQISKEIERAVEAKALETTIRCYPFDGSEQICRHGMAVAAAVKAALRGNRFALNDATAGQLSISWR